MQAMFLRKVMNVGNVLDACNECRDIFLWKCFEEILENRNNLFVNVLRKFINGHGVLWGRHWDARSYIFIWEFYWAIP